MVRGLPYARLRKYPYSLSFLHVSFSCCFHIITARKRSLGRLCFHRCLSVHRGCLPHCMLGYTPPAPGPEADTPVGKHLPGKTRPWVNTPWTDIPGAETPCSVHAGIRSTSRRYTSHWNAFLVWNVLRLYRSTTLSQEEPILQARDKGISVLYI